MMMSDEYRSVPTKPVKGFENIGGVFTGGISKKQQKRLAMATVPYKRTRKFSGKDFQLAAVGLPRVPHGWPYRGNGLNHISIRKAKDFAQYARGLGYNARVVVWRPRKDAVMTGVYVRQGFTKDLPDGPEMSAGGRYDALGRKLFDSRSGQLIHLKGHKPRPILRESPNLRKQAAGEYMPLWRFEYPPSDYWRGNMPTTVARITEMEARAWALTGMPTADITIGKRLPNISEVDWDPEWEKLLSVNVPIYDRRKGSWRDRESREDRRMRKKFNDLTKKLGEAAKIGDTEETQRIGNELNKVIDRVMDMELELQAELMKEYQELTSQLNQQLNQTEGWESMSSDDPQLDESIRTAAGDVLGMMDGLTTQEFMQDATKSIDSLVPELPAWFIDKETAEGIQTEDGLISLEEAGFREFGDFGIVSADERALIQAIVKPIEDGDEVFYFNGEVYDTELTRLMLKDRQINREARELAQKENWEPYGIGGSFGFDQVQEEAQRISPMFNPFDIAKEAVSNEVSFSEAHKLVLDEAMGIGKAWRFSERETEIIEHDQRLLDESFDSSLLLGIGSDTRKAAGDNALAALFEELNESTAPLLNRQEEVQADLQRMARILQNPNLPNEVIEEILRDAGQLGQESRQNRDVWEEVMSRMELSAGVGAPTLTQSIGLPLATEEDRNIARGLLTSLYIQDNDDVDGETIDYYLQRGRDSERAAGIGMTDSIISAQTPQVWIRSGNEISSIEFTEDGRIYEMESNEDGEPEGYYSGMSGVRPLVASGHTSYVIRDGYTEKTHTPFLTEKSPIPEVRRLAQMGDEVNFAVNQSELRGEELPTSPKHALFTSEAFAGMDPQTVAEAAATGLGLDDWRRSVTLAKGSMAWKATGDWFKAAFEFMGNNKKIPAPSQFDRIIADPLPETIEFKKEERLDGSYRIIVIKQDLDPDIIYEGIKRDTQNLIRSRTTGPNRALRLQDKFFREQTRYFIDNIVSAHNEQAIYWEQMLTTHGIEAVASSRVMTAEEARNYQDTMTDQFRRQMLGGN